MSQPLGFDAERMQALEGDIGVALLGIAPEADWARVELRAAVAGEAYQLRIAAVMDDGSTHVPEPAALDPEALKRIGEALLELRRVMSAYRPGSGTWFSMRLCLDSPEDYSAAYNFHHEPEWNPPLSEQVWLQDFETFPRDPFHLPDWLRGYLEKAQPGRWAGGGIVVEGPMDLGDQSELADEITALLVESLPTGYEMFNLHYRAVGSYVDADHSLVDLFMEDVDWTPPAKLLDMLGQLRVGMYRAGQGTWFTAHVRFDYISRLDIQFDWTAEPEWEGVTPPQAAFSEELRSYPRQPEAVPMWLEQKGSQVGRVLRLAKVHDGTIPVPGYPDGMPTWVDRPQLSEEEKIPVLAYLEQAPVVWTDQTVETDLLEPSRPQKIPRQFHTDGTWIWPISVAYYLRDHNAAPQRQLIEHIRSLDYRIPDVDAAVRSLATATVERDVKP